MNGQTPVIITDLRIPFLRLVLFFVKAGLAAIPAAIIVTVIVMLVAAIVAAALGGNPTLILRRWTL
jgi:VIT1/CCC1 family predicted Fe2+/Mn2+ transporter